MTKTQTKSPKIKGQWCPEDIKPTREDKSINRIKKTMMDSYDVSKLFYSQILYKINLNLPNEKYQPSSK